MTILERLLRHDAWTTRSLLERASELPDAELDREFDIGHRSLRRTFVHIIANMECWCDLMSGRPQPSDARAAKTANSIPGLMGRLDNVAERRRRGRPLRTQPFGSSSVGAGALSLLLSGVD
jgi:uncharacterized damage-inducible protein DinB